MQYAKNEKKVQEKDQERSVKNFIIHGVDEVGNNIDEIKVNDTEYIAQILKKIGVISNLESIARLGKPNDNETNKRTMIVNKRDDLTMFIAGDTPDVILITEVIPKKPRLILLHKLYWISMITNAC